MYMPSTAQLHLVREHIAADHKRFRRIVEARAFRAAVGALEGDALRRVPRGFPPDHPAGEYLKLRQFLAGCERPAEFAVSPGFYRGVLTVFKAVAPLLAFLNEPLVANLDVLAPARQAWTDADW
jgi:uncharacterized protein (DUF2461 family)